MTHEQWKCKEHEDLLAVVQQSPQLIWAQNLAMWLEDRGYMARESGAYNPDTGRGWYSHQCEYQHNKVRVRINLGGVIILRDPGATIEVSRAAPGTRGMRETFAPNMCRIDNLYPWYSIADTVSAIRRQIKAFEGFPAWTLSEAEGWVTGEVLRKD